MSNTQITKRRFTRSSYKVRKKPGIPRAAWLRGQPVPRHGLEFVGTGKSAMPMWVVTAPQP